MASFVSVKIHNPNGVEVDENDEDKKEATIEKHLKKSSSSNELDLPVIE